MVGSGFVNFALRNAAPPSRQLALTVLLGLVIGALLVGVAVTAFPILSDRSQTMALWLLALAIVSLAVTVLENIGMLSAASLREAVAKASTGDRAQWDSVRVAVDSAREWAHYLAKIFDGVTIFVFYAALYRFALVPRFLAVFGLVAAPLMITSLARPLFGYDVLFPMLAPLGLSQLILALWLVTKGFRDEA